MDLLADQEWAYADPHNLDMGGKSDDNQPPLKKQRQSGDEHDDRKSN